jgi:hypothetical protein
MNTLPDWVPAEAWAGYVEMRASIKKPMKTERAFTLAINTLKKLADEGNDPGSVLDQSVMHSWIGLFAVRVERRGLPRQIESRLGVKGQATANNAHAWLEEQA